MRPRPDLELTPEEARKDHRDMLRFLAVNAAFGMALGAGVAAALLLFDIGGLGTRIIRSQNPVLLVFMVAFPMALTFGGAVTASAIMLMPYKRRKEMKQT